MNSKKKAVLERINNIEAAITKAQEYLKSGKHKDWHGFRPLFSGKTRNGQVLPPHEDWIRNVFLPRQHTALRKNQKLLENLTQQNSKLRRT